MDQVPSTDKDEAIDECGLPFNSLMKPSEGVFENDSNLVGDGIASSHNNEESPEKLLPSLFETENPTSENDVSSTYCAENDVIPTEDGPVVEQHSTYEAVNDFSDVDNSSSMEQDAECSSEQPNVDTGAPSNVYNPVEEVPSASDHIEQPSESDHISSASDHVELPSISDQIELPSSSDHIELPPVSDLIDLPSHSDETEEPSASDNMEPPSESDLMEPPSMSDLIKLPLVSDHNKVSSPFDYTAVAAISSPPCAVADTNVEASTCTEGVSNAAGSPVSQIVTNAEASPILEAGCTSEASSNIEDVTNAEASPNTDVISFGEASCQAEVINNAVSSLNAKVVTYAEASPSTEGIIHAESSTNTDVITNAESQLNTEVDTNAEGSANAEVVTSAEARADTEVVTHEKAGLNLEIITNSETRPDTDVTNDEFSLNMDVSTDAGAVTNTKTSSDTDATNEEFSLNTDVVTNAETSPDTDVTIDESSLNTDVVTNAETSSDTDVSHPKSSLDTKDVTNVEARPNPDSLPNENYYDAPKIQNICDSPGKETNPNNVESVDHRNNFFPTIVAIRGGCTDVLDKTKSLPEDVSSSTPEISGLNIVSVLGGCKDVDLNKEIDETNVGSSSPKKLDQIVHVISDSEETASNECPVNPVDGDITIKQEPHDRFSDNDSVHTGTELGTTSSISEFPIKENDASNTKTEDPDVICIETTSEIPLPIPIKMESNIEGLNVKAESQSPNKVGKFTAKKRLTRSSVSQSDDCIILSSSSDVDSVSDSKKRNRSSTTAYSTAGYTCHLCNTVFHEHELLNEHMILHRNNSLIEAKVQSRSKTTKMKGYSCNICQKQLSTSQSLQQHVLIHKKEKPYACSTCQKDFRHLQNYRMHLQKHKAEQRHQGKSQPQGIKEQLDRSVVRGVDFGRLVGPLFMKESLYHQEKDSGSSKNLASDAATNKKTVYKYMTKESASHQPRLSFDQPPFKSNVHSSSSSPVIIRRREPSPEVWSEEECVAVKSFSNIESVVMNAAKIIVKLDNLDTSVLKRKLQTPDISIDQPPKKCRIMLSPIAEKCNIKLDEIENIPMDIDVGDVDLPAAQQDSDGDDYPNAGNEDAADSSVCPPQGTLTDNELFDLLNDDTVSAESSDHGSSGMSQIFKPAHCTVDNSTSDSSRIVASPSPKRSNVIFMEAPTNYETCAYEDEETIYHRQDDAFDTAFQKVALRRLALVRKRATENGGKVESRYLLGPLFWHKALRRAQKQPGDRAATTNVDITFSSSKNGGRSVALRTRPSPFGGRSRFDDRRTNDPTKLQLRAERKFKYLLELAKMLNDLNSVNLAGPLFWRRTLQLAGVRRGEDLRMHVNVTSPTLDGIEFVDDDGQLCDFNDILVNAGKMSPSQPSNPIQTSDQVQPTLSKSVQPLPSNSAQLSVSHRVQPPPVEVPAACNASNDRQSSDQPVTGEPPFANNDEAGNVTKPGEEMQMSLAHPLPPDNDAVAPNTSNQVTSLKTDSILYESLTKPKAKQQKQSTSDDLPANYADSAGLLVASQGTAAESSHASHSKVEAEENRSNDQSNHQYPELTGDAAIDEGIAKLAAIDSGSIVLNVDSGGGLQLIPAGDSIAGAGQNFVLVSDGSGTMQYMVNVPADNFGNFELINGAGGDQVAYAIQFDGENYAAVQFVQDGGIQLQSDPSIKEAQMLVDPKAATYLVPDASATATAVADPNHIGKELSDFLNLDYGNLLKNGSANQPVS